MEIGGAGSSGSGSESHGNDSHGYTSSAKSKDSALLESLSSNKSSEQSTKAQKQAEVFRTLKALKEQVAWDRRGGTRLSTLHTLRYALQCVHHVSAKEQFYHMLEGEGPPGVGVASYTIQQIDSITSQYTLKNTDLCVLVISLLTGVVEFVSEQMAGILHCQQEVIQGSKFTDMINPHDVAVFYSATSPYHLPAYEASSPGLKQEKSFFCRISGGVERGMGLQYYPFRMTPYLLKLEDSQYTHTHTQHTHSHTHTHIYSHSHTRTHLCCLLLAERVHSGYKASRMKTEKRLFTTTHTPSCELQDVDERVAPLLGYLPQDLIGTSLLLHLHPKDRPAMLAVHQKILQNVGQPFDQSSVRFCVRNGEYVTVDTSWSSFINPWTHKVAFIFGRHKVRMGPVNEDVFAAPAFTQSKLVDSDIQELTQEIHKLLLQPILCVDSSCHDNTAGASSVDGNTMADENTKQERCKAVQQLNSQDKPSASRPEPRNTSDGVWCSGVRLNTAALLERDGTSPPDSKSHQSPSYQQISCLNTVIRYLDSCNMKRKCCLSSSTSSTSEEDMLRLTPHTTHVPSRCEARPTVSTRTKRNSPPGLRTVTLSPPMKAESVVSQCSYSSTIVHVGDKKDTIEEPESPAVAPPPEGGAYRKLGLTKQVLATHTQLEKMAFIARYSHTLHTRLGLPGCPETRAATGRAELNTKTSGQNRKSKKPRMKQPDWSASGTCQGKPLPLLQGCNQTSWSPSETFPSSQPVFSAPPFPLPPGSQAPPMFPPLAAPVMAVVHPNYLYPQLAYNSQQPFQQQLADNTPQPFLPQPAYNSQQPSQPQLVSNSSKLHHMDGASGHTSPLPSPSQLPGPSHHALGLQQPVAPPSPSLPIQSRSSSPLNLLQLDEHSTPAAPEEPLQAGDPVDGCHSDGHSSSSEMVELLLQDDSQSGSSSGISSSSERHVDQSDADHKSKGRGLMKYVLQEPLWLLMADVDEHVMMTYQLPARKLQQVLREDRERLRRMQKNQPRFSTDQRRELIDTHPWVRRGQLPPPINLTKCVFCGDDACAPEEEDLDMEHGIVGQEAEPVSHAVS